MSNPSVENGVTNVPTTATLSWSPAVDPNSGDSVVYFIYFGTSPTPPLAFSGWATNWSPGHLRGLTTYYWQVVARDSHNAQTASPVWSFTTGNEPPVADFVASSHQRLGAPGRDLHRPLLRHGQRHRLLAMGLRQQRHRGLDEPEPHFHLYHARRLLGEANGAGRGWQLKPPWSKPTSFMLWGAASLIWRRLIWPCNPPDHGEV